MITEIPEDVRLFKVSESDVIAAENLRQAIELHLNLTGQEDLPKGQASQCKEIKRDKWKSLKYGDDSNFHDQLLSDLSDGLTMPFHFASTDC